MELLMEYMAKGFVIMLIISMPCVLVAALIGLVIGILQAVTQVQEQTIAAAPKILAVFLVIMIGAYGYVKLMTNLITEGLSIAFNVIPKNESYVLPSDYYKYTRPFDGEMNDKIPDKSNLKQLMENKAKGNFSKLNGSQQMQYFPAGKNQPVKPNFIEQRKILGR
jgi:type III secretory pathway component EscS